MCSTTDNRGILANIPKWLKKYILGLSTRRADEFLEYLQGGAPAVEKIMKLLPISRAK